MAFNKFGFSLIELIVVIAIIGILSAVAVPAYNNYQIRVRMTDAINRIEPLKHDFEKQYAITGDMSAAGNSLVSFSDDEVDAAWNGGAIRVYIQGDLDTAIGGGPKQLLLTPVFNEDSSTINWTCGAQYNYAIACKYLPSNCQGPYCY